MELAVTALDDALQPTCSSVCAVSGKTMPLRAEAGRDLNSVA
jgi:hypothetical protein